MRLVDGVIGPRNKLVYLLGDDGWVYVLEVRTGKQVATFNAVPGGAEPLGVVHHPHQNLVATFAKENKLRLWSQSKSHRHKSKDGPSSSAMKDH